MAFLETGKFCTQTEYFNHIGNRLHESQLKVGELGVMMLRLSSEKREAAKKPVRIIEVQEKTGLAVVRFALLDDNLDTQADTTETVANGLIDGVKGAHMIDPKDETRLPIRQAYVRDYFEEQFGGALREEEALLVGASN